MIDYKNLLLNYISFIYAYEGTDFLSCALGIGGDFTAEELIELRKLSQQVYDELRIGGG